MMHYLAWIPVFHSVQWIKPSGKYPTTWKGNDFLILHKDLGCLVLEVKGGGLDYRGGVFYQMTQNTGEEYVLDPKLKKIGAMSRFSAN